jgi:MFS family permease
MAIVTDEREADVRDQGPVDSASPAPKGGATLAVTSVATALVLVIFTVPLTTLTRTAQALGANAGAQAWILSAMSVGPASGLLASGAIGDDYGRRRTFLAGTVLLALASVLGAVASTSFLLIVARIVQGLGGAAILACGLGLIGQCYPGKALARATGTWAAALGAGVAVGPILAAGLNALGGWPAAYWFSAAAAAVLAVAGRLFLAESRAAHPRRIDYPGTLVLGFAMAAFLSGLTQSRMGWNQPSPYILLIGGLVLMGAFVAVERRLADPMLDLALFGRLDFAGAIVAALASGAGVLSIMSMIPPILERALGVSTLAAPLFFSHGPRPAP